MLTKRRCATGIEHPTGQVCCNASCGLCGGHGCSIASGGPAQCCMPAILRSRRQCASRYDVACAIATNATSATPSLSHSGIHHRTSIRVAATFTSATPSLSHSGIHHRTSIIRVAAIVGQEPPRQVGASGEAARDSRQPWGRSRHAGSQTTGGHSCSCPPPSQTSRTGGARRGPSRRRLTIDDELS